MTYVDLQVSPLKRVLHEIVDHVVGVVHLSELLLLLKQSQELLIILARVDRIFYVGEVLLR